MKNPRSAGLNGQYVKKAFLALFFFYVAYSIATILVPARFQCDFFCYYQSIRAFFDAGISPYDTTAVSGYCRHRVLPFVYPPVTIPFFRVFTLFRYEAAIHLFSTFKLAVLYGLIYLWWSEFLDKPKDTIFPLLCLFAFRNPIFIDLRVGNISILEQMLIWSAFLFYLRRQFLIFCVLIILSACFKVQPILFLFLLLLADERRKYRYLAGAFIAFGTINLAQYFFSPALFYGFIHNALRLEELGMVNPSQLALIKEIALKTNNPTALDLHFFAYLLTASWLFFVARDAFFKFRTRKLPDAKIIVFFACLLYSVITPRFCDYSHILLIPPVYFAISRFPYIRKPVLFFVILLLPDFMGFNCEPLPGINTIHFFLRLYYPLFISLFVFALYVRHSKEPAGRL